MGRGTLASLLVIAALSAFPAPALAEEEARPDPLVAAGLALGAPAGLYAISQLTPFHELMFLVPATYGAGHVYAKDPWRALSMSAGGYGAAVAGIGVGVALAALWPGTAAESLSRVLWGGAFGALGFGPFVAYDAMRTAETAKAAPPAKQPIELP